MLSETLNGPSVKKKVNVCDRFYPIILRYQVSFLLSLAFEIELENHTLFRKGPSIRIKLNWIFLA